MPQFRIVEIADVLRVSDDTVRRWIDTGELDAGPDGRGRRVVDGASAARLAQHRGRRRVATTARNRFVGIVTELERGPVMCRVEMLCGDVTIESLISTEAADELGIETGSIAVATAAATQVIVERA